MSQPASTQGGPGQLRRAKNRLRVAHVAAEEFQSLVDLLEEYPYPEFVYPESIESSCLGLADHANRLI